MMTRSTTLRIINYYNYYKSKHFFIKCLVLCFTAATFTKDKKKIQVQPATLLADVTNFKCKGDYCSG